MLAWGSGLVRLCPQESGMEHGGLEPERSAG